MERNIVPRRWLRLGSANDDPIKDRLNARTLHLNSQKNGLDNGVHLLSPCIENSYPLGSPSLISSARISTFSPKRRV